MERDQGEELDWVSLVVVATAAAAAGEAAVGHPVGLGLFRAAAEANGGGGLGVKLELGLEPLKPEFEFEPAACCGNLCFGRIPATPKYDCNADRESLSPSLPTASSLMKPNAIAAWQAS